MKKLCVITVLLITYLINSVSNLSAQNKFGYFDIDYVISLMPGISRVDTLLTAYEKDSLGQQYQTLVKEYMVYDSLLKVRNCGIGRKTIEIEKENKRIYQISHRLQNWMEYSQKEMKAKHQELIKLFYDKAMTAYQDIVSRENYTYVFKKNIFWQASPTDNLAIPVLIRLGLKVPDELLQQDKPLRSALPVRRTQ